MVKQLRQNLLEELKPEVTSFAREYAVTMENRKTRLNITKVSGQPTRVETNDYIDLFGKDQRQEKRRRLDETALEQKLLWAYSRKGSVARAPGRRILIRGDHGQGKTTLVQKIAWDWAKGIFTSFSIVFCVFLKLVKPGDALENFIIEDARWKSLNFLQDKLKFILETFGHECLIIIDGVEDNLGSRHDELMKIVTGEKFYNCNFLLTAESSKSEQFGSEFFRTICEVQGFPDNGDSFISELMRNKQKVEALLSCKPSIPRAFSTSECRNPLVVTMLCVLADNDEIDLQDSRVTLSEIYTRYVRFLYKKYTTSAFTEEMKVVGKLALVSLQMRRMLPLRDQQPSEGGNLEASAFHHGLLQAHRNSLVTFPHVTLQIYVAAFYVVQMLNDGASVGDLLGPDCSEPIFMMNSLFLYFCLQLLSQQEYFAFSDEVRAYSSLQSYVLERINLIQLDLTDFAALYPALTSLAFQDKDDAALEFLKNLLSRCRKTRTLYLNPENPVDVILTDVAPIITNLTFIHLADQEESVQSDFLDSEDLKVIVQSEKWVDQLLQTLDASGRRFCLEYKGNKNSKPVIDLSRYLRPRVTRLSIVQTSLPCMIVTRSDAETCPVMTHLHITAHLTNKQRTMTDLDDAIRQAKFPSLTHLKFSVWCNKPEPESRRRTLEMLFKMPCATLTHLDMGDTELSRDDVRYLGVMKIKGGYIFSDVTSLTMKPESFSADSNVLFRPPWNRLTHLKLHGACNFVKTAITDSTKNLHDLEMVGSWGTPQEASEEKKSEPTLQQFLTSLPPLRSLTINEGSKGHCSTIGVQNLAEYKVIRDLNHLDLSGCRFALSLSKVLYRGLPVLKSLVLSNCDLYPQDLRSLAQANVEGWIPELRHLDVSHNTGMIGLENLFDFENKWEKLETLKAERNDAEAVSDFHCLWSQVETGSLGSLRHLSLSVPDVDYFPQNTGAHWRSLRRLELSSPEVKPPESEPSLELQAKVRYSSPALCCRDILRPIAVALEKDVDRVREERTFPALETVVVTLESAERTRAAAEARQRIRKHGVEVFCIARIFCSA